MQDTSHYAECATILLKQKNAHMKRFLFVLILTVCNGYFHVITMSMWRAEDGVFPIAIFGFGFFWAVFAFIHNIVLVILALIGSPDRPVLCWFAIGTAVLGLILNLLSPFLGVPIAIILLFGLANTGTASWLKKQPGYPYFNERFAQQGELAYHDYRPDHGIRDRAASAMQDIAQATDVIPTPATAEMPSVDALIPDVAQAPPVPASTSLPTPEAAPAIAAAAPVITEAAAPARAAKKHWNFKQMLREEEQSDVPQVDFEVNTDIPDPVWDIPDPVMDTSSILSSVPDIAGDIQNLPDIPDIPKI